MVTNARENMFMAPLNKLFIPIAFMDGFGS